MDQIDTIWSSFRLPIPITIKNTNDTKTNGGGPYDEWLLKVLDLLRLLHTMNQQYQTTKTSNASSRSSNSNAKQLMHSQMKLAYSHLDKIQLTFPPISSNVDVDNDEMIVNNQMFHQNLHTLLQKLRYDTEEICVKFQHWLTANDRQQNNNITMEGEEKERDLIYDMFLAQDDTYEKEGGEQNDNDSEELLLDDFSDDGNGILDDEYEGNNEPASSSTPVKNQSQQQQQMRKQHHAPRRREEEVVDPVEFQKQQQELLEQELSDMATRLKQSTLAMNATLQTQTKDLDDMEEIAQNNLDSVTDTAQKVEQRLQAKKGWKKRIATWSLIGTVIGMWILCFMVMRTVPKRQVGEVHFFQRSTVAIRKIWDRIKPTMDDRNEREYAAKYAAMFENMEDDDWDSEDEEEWQQQRRAQNQDKKRAWEQQQQRQDYDKHDEEEKEEECEILSDGTQICPDEDERMEAKARELAAEKKRRRIEEKMANAPIVEAVEGGLVDDVHVKQEDTQDGNDDDDDDPMGCIPSTDAMRIQQSAKESSMKALEDINRLHQKTQPESTQRMNLERHRSKMEEDLKKHSSMLEMEMNNARSTFWADKSNIVKARDQKRALGSIPFCSGGDDDAVNNEEEFDIDRERQRRIDEAKRKEEFQQRLMEEKEAQTKAEELMEKQRLASEKAAKQAELERLEQERLAKEKQAELERVVKERIQKAEAERLEQERLAAENKRLEQERLAAEEAAKQTELDRLEQKREEERLAAEEARLKAEQIEKEKLEAENIEKEKLAVEEAKRVELEMLEQKRLPGKENVLEKARAEASEAVKLAAQIAIDSPEFHPADVRVAAGNKKNDLLAHYISSAPEMVDVSDRRGWSPIHEAARAGNLVGIQLLVDAGCDLTSRTGRKGDGGTALWWAVQRYGEDHDVVQLLRSHGALEAGPET